jgi:hypothetical protein
MAMTFGATDKGWLASDGVRITGSYRVSSIGKKVQQQGDSNPTGAKWLVEANSGYQVAGSPVGKIISVEPDGSCTVEWQVPATQVQVHPASPGWLDTLAGITWTKIGGGHSDPAAPTPRPKRTAAKRDKNLSLLCCSCGEPYPYAVPEPDGHFTCTSCKSYRGM